MPPYNLSTGAQWLSAAGTFGGALGSIYGGIKQSQAASRMINLNEQRFDFNKAQILKDEADRKKRQESFANAFGTGMVDLNQGA